MAVDGLTQFRFYKDNDPRNAPFPTRDYYVQNIDFSIYAKIKYMMIYTLPGTKIYINTGEEHSDMQGIIVGETGLYTIDLRETDWNDRSITTFKVDPKSMDIIESNPAGHLILILAHEEIKPV